MRCAWDSSGALLAGAHTTYELAQIPGPGTTRPALPSSARTAGRRARRATSAQRLRCARGPGDSVPGPGSRRAGVRPRLGVCLMSVPGTESAQAAERAAAAAAAAPGTADPQDDPPVARAGEAAGSRHPLLAGHRAQRLVLLGPAAVAGVAGRHSPGSG